MSERVPFLNRFRNRVMLAAYRQGLPWNTVDLAMTKWEGGLQVSDIRCAEEGKGKPYGLETECKCVGCSERRAFAFFDQVRQRFGVGDI